MNIRFTVTESEGPVTYWYGNIHIYSTLSFTLCGLTGLNISIKEV